MFIGIHFGIMQRKYDLAIDEHSRVCLQNVSSPSFLLFL